MIGFFLDQLRSEDIDGGKRWRLLARLRFYSVILDRVIDLPKGFVADSYSVPCDLIGPWIVHDIDRRPAFLHDFLYRQGSGVSRAQADSVLREAMESVGISWWRRSAIYAGVRVGGRAHFQKKEAT